jgi:hypothetical protein
MRKKKGEWLECINLMEVGQSISLPKEIANKFRQSVANNHPEFRLKSRKEGKSFLRLWKVPKNYMKIHDE